MESNNDITYTILIIGMTSFYIGFSSYGGVHILKRQENSNEKILRYTNKLVTNKITLVLYVICSLFALSYAKNALAAAALNDGAIMFENRLELIFKGSSFGALLYGYILIPLFYLTLTLLVITILNKIKCFLFYILSGIFLVSYMILAGGRNIFVIMLMYLLISYISLNSNKKLFSKKKILTGLILCVLVISGMAFQTGYRKTGHYELSGDDFISSFTDMSEMFVIYSVIPIRLFDIALNNDVPEKLGGLQYGRASIAGTDEVVCGLIKRITGAKPHSTIEIVKYTQDTWIKIIPGKWGYNYCYTAVFYNYMDFGILGVILLPFIFGYILRYFVFQFLKYRSLPSLVIISFGYFMMLHSLFTCYFIKNWVLMFCVLTMLWQYFTCNKPLKFLR